MNNHEDLHRIRVDNLKILLERLPKGEEDVTPRVLYDEDGGLTIIFHPEPKEPNKEKRMSRKGNSPVTIEDRFDWTQRKYVELLLVEADLRNRIDELEQELATLKGGLRYTWHELGMWPDSSGEWMKVKEEEENELSRDRD